MHPFATTPPETPPLWAETRNDCSPSESTPRRQWQQWSSKWWSHLPRWTLPGSWPQQTQYIVRLKMRERMGQAEIDALLKDSMFEDSEVRQSQSQVRPPPEHPADQYGNDEFQSYEESRRTFKNNSKIATQKVDQINQKLQAIKEEPAASPKQPLQTQQRAKSGIYFDQKLPPTGKSSERKNLPYNYSRISQRERQLLLTTLAEENKQLKESLRLKDEEYRKLQGAYKLVLQDKAHSAPSVRQATLQKQLATLTSKYEKLQELTKLQKPKQTFTSTKVKETFVAETVANEREQELLQIVQQLRERLLSTTNQLKTLQNKMNEGQDYVQQLRRKLRRIEQLQFKMGKMVQQAENDRLFIESLTDKNKRLQQQLQDLQREKRMMEIQIRRLQLGDDTKKDCFTELEMVRKEKEVLERNLRELTSNLMTKVRTTYKESNRIEDSGELLRPS